MQPSACVDVSSRSERWLLYLAAVWGRICPPKRWIDERPNLRPKTIRLYRCLLRGHIAPQFESKTIGEIKDAHVWSWRKKLLDSGVSMVTTAKAYRLLKAILNTAVDDGIIRRNPCRIKGAGQEQSAERPAQAQ